MCRKCFWEVKGPLEIKPSKNVCRKCFWEVKGPLEVFDEENGL